MKRAVNLRGLFALTGIAVGCGAITGAVIAPAGQSVHDALVGGGFGLFLIAPMIVMLWGSA